MSEKPAPKKSNRRVQSTSANRRQYVLDVKMRQSTARKVRRHKVSGWVWSMLLWVGIIGGSAISIQTLLEKFFFKNPDYNIQQVQTDLSGILRREDAIAQTGIHEGMNIFSVNLEAAQRTMLKIPEVKNATIERELPAIIRIQLEPRQPVAWISSSAGPENDSGNLENSQLVDATGFVYKPMQVRVEHSTLPVIYGIELEELGSGESLNRQDLRAALELIAANQQKPDSPLFIRSLDIRKGYCIDVISDRNAHIIFNASDFEEQLDRLQKLLIYSTETTREIETVNLIPKRNTPVRFIMAAVAEPTPKRLKKN